MLVAYFDETYTKDTRHCVFALVMPADSAAYVEDGLNEVLEKSAQSFEGLSPSIELHGYELASGEGSWAHMKKQVRARIGIYRQALEVIANTPGAVLCSGQVNLSTRLVNDPHQWALTFALEKVNQIAQELDTHVMGICDDVENKLQYQNFFAKARRNGTGGYAVNKLEQFRDGLHFTPSHHSRLVQSVDMATYAWRRQFLQPYSDDRAKAAQGKLWQVIEDLYQRGRHRIW